MNVEEIVNELKYCNGKMPKGALQEAIEQKDKIIPELLKMLEYASKNIEQICSGTDKFFGYSYAMFLLAEFKEKEAFKYMLELLNKDQEIIDYILGDSYPDYLPRIIASIYNGDDEALFSIIEDNNKDQFVRSSVLQAFSILYLNDVKDREFIVNYYRKLIENKKANDNSYIYYEIFNDAKNLRLIELEDIIEKTFNAVEQKDEIDDLKTIFKDDNYTINKKEYPFKPFYEYMYDSIRIIETWDCFTNKFDEEFEESRYYEQYKRILNKRKKKGRIAKDDFYTFETLERIDFFVSKAQWYLDMSEDEKAHELLKLAWINVKSLCDKNEITTIEDYEQEYESCFYLSDWIQDYKNILEYSDKEEDMRELISLCSDIEITFSLESDFFLKQTLVRARAKAEFKLGNEDKAIRIIQRYLQLKPNWIWGYIEMADWYDDKKNKEKYNIQKVKEILTKAEETVKEDLDVVYERLSYVYKELGDKELAQSYSQKAKDIMMKR